MEMPLGDEKNDRSKFLFFSKLEEEEVTGKRRKKNFFSGCFCSRWKGISLRQKKKIMDKTKTFFHVHCYWIYYLDTFPFCLEIPASFPSFLFIVFCINDSSINSRTVNSIQIQSKIRSTWEAYLMTGKKN